MVTNIGILSKSGVTLSIGQYNHKTLTLELWMYHSRAKREGKSVVITIPEFDMHEYKQAQRVLIIDLDWDYRYETTYNKFKRIPVIDGVRTIDVSKLNKIA